MATGTAPEVMLVVMVARVLCPLTERVMRRPGELLRGTPEDGHAARPTKTQLQEATGALSVQLPAPVAAMRGRRMVRRCVCCCRW